MEASAMDPNADGWMKSADVLSVFPTLVWKVHLGEERQRDIDVRVRQLLEATRAGLPPLQAGEAWQSQKDLHALAELSDLVDCIHRAAGSVIKFLKIGYEAFEITACWVNIVAPGGSHRIHSHPNNFLSGVYYVQIRPGADTINFHDPRNQTAIIRPPVTALTRENTDQVVVNVSEGTLLVFPAYLEHSVDTNRSGEERISVSFNLMFSAFTENLSKPLW